jgi:hypothetical protein
MDSHAIIASVPVTGADRALLVDVANAAFEAVIERIEPANEEKTRSLWDPGSYIDNFLSDHADKLPMPREEVAYYIDVFLVHHVIDLAVTADREAVGRGR